jgi:cell wall assembly regulator SMI1
MAEDPPYRYVKTWSWNRKAHEAAKIAFSGYDEAQIQAIETELNVTLPNSYGAFLRSMGKKHGELFRGSNVARLDELVEYRSFAVELLRECGASWDLPNDAIVFLHH